MRALRQRPPAHGSPRFPLKTQSLWETFPLARFRPTQQLKHVPFHPCSSVSLLVSPFQTVSSGRKKPYPAGKSHRASTKRQTEKQQPRPPARPQAAPTQASGAGRDHFARDQAPASEGRRARRVGRPYPGPENYSSRNPLGTRPPRSGLHFPESPAGLLSGFGRFSFTGNAEGGVIPHVPVPREPRQSLASAGWRLRSLV